MQLKNTEKRNHQFYFYKGEGEKASLEYVHIPGGATVEIDDDIFKTLCSSTVKSEQLNLVEVTLTEEEIGAEVKTGKEKLTIKEYYPTGKFREVNLLKELIKSGKLVVVERAKVGMKEVDSVLTSKGVPITGMSEDAKLALYDKLV